MAQTESPENCAVYEDLNRVNLPFDSFTAASNGDLTYFTKHAVGKSCELFSAANKSGWTPIMYACSRGHALLVSYLVMCGVKTGCRTNSKVTPLMLAIASGDMPTVECAFNPADLECKDYRMWTPLFYAVYFLQETCVEFLLNKGADVDIVDYQNETPLILAIKLRSEKIVMCLLKKATNLDVVSYKNESAIMLAKQCSNNVIRESVLNRDSILRESRAGKTGEETPRKRFLLATKKNLTPSPKTFQNISILGLKLNRSHVYSPNRSPATGGKNASASVCPRLFESDSVKTPLWKMCVQKPTSPSNAHYDIPSLLYSLGLEKYWPVFRDEEVDFETLLTFSEENLIELGITLFGPRKKILFAIQQLRACTRK